MSIRDAADEQRLGDRAEGGSPRAEEQDGVLTLSHPEWPVDLTTASDYGPLLDFFGLNRDTFEIVDPGKISRWQQSARSKDGDRDKVWLFSYSGVKFRRVTDEDLMAKDALDQAVERSIAWRPPIRRTLGMGLGEPVTYVHHQGDTQAGKDAGGGLVGLQQREEAALEKSLNYTAQLMARGVNIEAIADLESGDRVEGIFGHYSNQPRTTATMRDQYRYAVETETTRLKALAELGLPVIAPRTPSNHGEHRPAVGVSPLTSESDNLDLQIAETVKFVLDQGPLGQQIEWHIPDDEFITTFELSGVGVGLTHGHKIRGSGTAAIEKWTMAQRDRLMFHENFRLRVLAMGHFHHLLAEELSGTSVIMSPSLDGGSDWFTQGSGQVATPGLLGYTVGTAHTMGWSNLQAF